MEPTLAQTTVIACFRRFLAASAMLIVSAPINAATFIPASDTDISVLTNTEFQYDLYTIGDTITVNYLTTGGTSIDIISQGDITIDGNLFATDAILSLTSINGSINLLGSISASSLTITADAINTGGTGSGTGGSGSTINSGGTITVGNAGTINLVAGTIDPGLSLIISDPGNITLSPSITPVVNIIPGGNFVVTLNPVPLPPALLLFLTGLTPLLLTAWRRRYAVAQSCVR